MTVSSTNTCRKDPLAPITLGDVLALKTSLQAVLQPEAATVAAVPTLLTTNELADAGYAEYMEDRFARYGY